MEHFKLQHLRNSQQIIDWFDSEPGKGEFITLGLSIAMHTTVVCDRRKGDSTSYGHVVHHQEICMLKPHRVMTWQPIQTNNILTTRQHQPTRHRQLTQLDPGSWKNRLLSRSSPSCPTCACRSHGWTTPDEAHIRLGFGAIDGSEGEGTSKPKEKNL